MDLKFKDNSKLEITLFTQLEYIESTGTQWIDTGFKPNQNTKAEFEFSYTENNVADLKTICGVDGGTYNNAAFSLNAGGDQYKIGFCFGINGEGNYTASLNTKYKGVIEKNSQRLLNENGNVLHSDAFNSVFISNYNLTIFALNRAGNILANSLIRIYSFKLYDNGTLIRDFVPATNTTGIVCLYDKVSNAYYLNQGTGYFTAGPVVSTGLPNNILIKTTTLYHKNTSNVNGQRLLDYFFKYQKTHQDEVKEYYYPTTQLWQDIITEYPDILYWYNLNPKLCIYICEADSPEQYTDDFLQAVDSIQQELEDYPDLIPIIAENPTLAPIIAENPEVVHSLIDTGYESSIKGNGAQYLDTGLVGNSTMEIQLRIKYGDVNRSDLIFGNKWDAGAYLVHRHKPSNYVIRGYWGGYVDCPISDVTKFINFSYKANFISVDNTGYLITGTPSQTSGNIVLFGFPNESYFNQFSQVSYYKRYDGNVLVQWLVPIENNGNPCMIDLLTGTKYLNQGTGSFTYSLESKNA